MTMHYRHPFNLSLIIRQDIQQLTSSDPVEEVLILVVKRNSGLRPNVA
ncbi:hypothetical protein BURPS305_3303 [Burkholderia pseudomallei 305]|nr:hypothetical protein BURPS305_3303 [Burkholderia pseudomallei 305]